MIRFDSQRFDIRVSVSDDADITVWLTDTNTGQHYPFDEPIGAVIAASRLGSGEYETDQESWDLAQKDHYWSL